MSRNRTIGRLRAGGGGALYLGLNGPFDFYVDAVNGNDGNAGTSEALAWKSLKKITQSLLTASTTTRVLVKTGMYNTADDYLLVQSAPAASHLLIAFEPGCVMDGTAANLAVPGTNGTELSGASLHYTTIYGNGLTIQNYSEATAASPNGLGNRGVNFLTGYDGSIINCDDGASSHENATRYLFDWDISDCEKSAFADVDNAAGFHYRCIFTGRAGAALGIGRIANDTASGRFEDSVFIPATSGQTLGVRNSTLVRCQIGTLTLRVDLETTSPTLPANISDSFLNLYQDGSGGAVIYRCYGKLSLRTRSGGTQSVTHSVFSGPATGKGSIIVREAALGAQTLTFNNNICETATAAAFMDVDATTAGQMVAAGQTFHNNILNGAAAFDADLIAADTGGTVISGTITADALIGAANTLQMADYAYATGSPAIGAGTSGTNIGFGASDVQERRTRVPALP